MLGWLLDSITILLIELIAVVFNVSVFLNGLAQEVPCTGANVLLQLILILRVVGNLRSRRDACSFYCQHTVLTGKRLGAGSLLEAKDASYRLGIIPDVL